MSDDTPAKPELPGNKGQFGEGDATENFQPLQDGASPKDEAPAPGEAKGPKQTHAGERS